MYQKKRTQEKETTDLADYVAKVIVQLEEEKKYPAKRTYRATLNSFMEFSGGAGVEMPIGIVFTPGRLKKYEGWLRSRERSWNTVSTYMRTLQAVYNRLYPPGSTGRNSKLFDDVYTKVESRTKRALTEEQMQVFTEAAFRALPLKMSRKKRAETPAEDVPEAILEKVPQSLHRAMAYFLLMFLFRGMPFIDLAYLRKSDLKGNLLVYHRHKTGRQMTVQITTEAAQFLEEYKDKRDASPYLFPVLNGTLTDDAALYNDYLSALRRFNSDLRELAELLFPGTVKISSYTARHTWATLMFHMGVPVGIICEALGHSSIRVTETYLKPFGNEKVDKANKKLISSIMKPKGEHSSMYSSL